MVTLKIILVGSIGSKLPCGTKNSPPEVNTNKSLFDTIALIALTSSVSRVASTASSANCCPGAKLKKSETTDPHTVAGLDLDPPKNNKIF